MNIAFHIPEWAMWVIGIPVGVVSLGLVVLGVQFLRILWTFRPFG